MFPALVRLCVKSLPAHDPSRFFCSQFPFHRKLRDIIAIHAAWDIRFGAYSLHHPLIPVCLRSPDPMVHMHHPEMKMPDLSQSPQKMQHRHRIVSTGYARNDRAVPGEHFIFFHKILYFIECLFPHFLMSFTFLLHWQPARSCHLSPDSHCSTLSRIPRLISRGALSCTSRMISFIVSSSQSVGRASRTPSVIITRQSP